MASVRKLPRRLFSTAHPRKGTKWVIVRLRRECRLLALFGPPTMPGFAPFLEAKRTSPHKLHCLIYDYTRKLAAD
jgi:hypothetical protein